jgi:hypothetical protein
MFVEVGDALSEVLEPATPAQRAALYEVAARIPGVELLGLSSTGSRTAELSNQAGRRPP